MAYLDSNPPARSQFRSPRRATPSGVIAVHTAENAPDFVAFDGSAESVARFIVGRADPGSYHDLVDSDSCVNLVDYNNEAFHDGTGTNPHSYGLSIATRADVWPYAPQAWRDGAVEQAAQAAARYARWIKARHGITIPATRITAAQARNRVPGFTTHAELDPGRRSDPGRAFPWAPFLARFAELTSTTPPAVSIQPSKEDAMTPEQRNEVVGRLDTAIGLLQAIHPAMAAVHVGVMDPASGVLTVVHQLANNQASQVSAAAIAAAIPDGLAKAVVDELSRRIAS